METYIEALQESIQNIPCKKGDVFYVINNGYGGDPKPGRPAVIVSNEHLSQTSDWVCIAYMTTQPKKAMPEHVTLFQNDAKVPQSTVLCERINCIPKTKLGQFMRHLSDAEIERIDTAVAISLGIGKGTVSRLSASQPQQYQQDAGIQEELKFYKRMCDYLTSKLKASGGAQIV